MHKHNSNILIILILSAVFYYSTSIAQVIPKNDSTSVVVNSAVDSTFVSNDSTFVQSDSTQTDSLANKPKELLSDVVKYTATDTIRTNVITQKVYLYNEAEVNYGDINLKAGKIFIKDHFKFLDDNISKRIFNVILEHIE